MTTLPLDLDIFLRSGSRIQPDRAASLHGRRVELEVGAHDGGEQPGPDDVVALRPQVHGPQAGEQVGVVLPPAGDLRA